MAFVNDDGTLESKTGFLTEIHNAKPSENQQADTVSITVPVFRQKGAENGPSLCAAKSLHRHLDLVKLTVEIDNTQDPSMRNGDVTSSFTTSQRVDESLFVGHRLGTSSQI